jgi:hypothetical protein
MISAWDWYEMAMESPSPASFDPGSEVELQAMKGRLLSRYGGNLVRPEFYIRRLADKSMRGKDLRGTDLREDDLTRMDLSGADLRGANLEGADLEGAILEDTIE